MTLSDLDEARRTMGLPAPSSGVPGLPNYGPIATLSLENIGDSVQWNWRQWGVPVHTRCWVTRITGLRKRHEFEREFLWGEKDYSKAGRSGNRGIYFHYRLRPGHIYHVCEPKSWGYNDIYYCHITGGEVVRMSEGEVLRIFSEANDERD